MFALTAYASLLNPKRKEDVALWLMGAQSEEGWSKSFVTLFDSVFSENHLSLKCLIRSVIASLIAVMAIWLLMGNADLIGLRMQSNLSLGWFLVTALVVNVIADYISLLETRWLLGRIPRSTFAQIGVLIFDFPISAAIIWVAIFLYLRSPLREGDVESFAEILGVFSVFSVFFYSTFLTSVWTWGYITSTWIMRLATRLRVAYWLDVENKPIKVLFLLLSTCLGGVTFLGAMALGTLFSADQDGITAADRTLCKVFKGQVCLEVAELTDAEHRQLEFLSSACEGGATDECMKRANAIWEVDGATAARLSRAACQGGSAISCSNMGFLYKNGIGVNPDSRQSARFYRQACYEGYAGGCTDLGMLHQDGIWMDADPLRAAELFRQGCDAGSARGCTNLGVSYEKGLGVDPDPQEAARLYQQGCDEGDPSGCTNLGFFLLEGIGMDPNLQEAKRLFEHACEEGDAAGCTNLGVLYHEGTGVMPDPQEAARLYRKGCDGDLADGCTNLGFLYVQGLGVDPDPKEAARLFKAGCDRGNATGCTNLGRIHQQGIGMDPNPEEAARLYRQGCYGGDMQGCALSMFNIMGVDVFDDAE